MEIQMYTEQRNNKKLKQLYHKVGAGGSSSSSSHRRLLAAAGSRLACVQQMPCILSMSVEDASQEQERG